MSEIKSKPCYIYLFTFPNGKQYVGQTERRYTERWSDHNITSRNPKEKSYDLPLYRAIRKYDWKNVCKEVLAECNFDEMNDLEVMYINKLKTLHPDGYNMTTGGKLNMVCCDETRQKMSEFQKKRFQNPEAIKVVSDAAKRRFANAEEKEKHSKRMKERDTSSFRRAPETIGVPKYITISRKRDKTVVYRVSGHPYIKDRIFGGCTPEESLKKAKAYLELGNMLPDLIDKLKNIININDAFNLELDELQKQIDVFINSIANCIEEGPETRQKSA